VVDVNIPIKDEWYPVLIMGDLEGFIVIIGREGQSTKELLEEVEELIKGSDGHGN